tara:strand:- start:175 stop:2565 length:2391 start_codon:yes stop_codon:yes gene_type:complete
MGSLVKSSLSGLSSKSADITPKGLALKQFSRTFNGGGNLNFVHALCGAQDFKNLNYTNFYLSNNILLDNVVTYTGDTKPGKTTILPEKFLTTLNFCNSGSNYLKFQKASKAPFIQTNDTYNAKFYGSPTFTNSINGADNFEITIVDKFTCRVAYLVNNYRYYLVVSDDPPEQHSLNANTKYVLFVGENKLPLAGTNLQYNFTTYSDASYINLYTTKDNERYILESSGPHLIANKISGESSRANEFFITARSIKLNQQTNITVTSPYNTSFVTYKTENNEIDNLKSDFNLTSNYLLYSSSNNDFQKFNLYNLKNIANNQDGFTSSNNLLSTSSTSIFAKNLRNYTSIFSDIDSEKNEVLALNYVYNNFDVSISPGTTFFTTPSSLSPFKSININDTKFVECGAFPFMQPYLSDRVYRIDDESIYSENATYLCTWLSGAPGTRGKWVDRYYYPDYVTKEAALNAKGTYNPTYETYIENLLKTNSDLKDSVVEKHFFDKKSDMLFEKNKRYRYERISIEDFTRSIPANVVGSNLTNYFKAINDRGGFGLGFTITNDPGAAEPGKGTDFMIKSARNNIDGGLEILKIGDAIRFIFKVFDNSNQKIASFVHSFNIDIFAKNNLFVNFNAKSGVGNLYLNSQNIFTFNVNKDQMVSKYILFGDISCSILGGPPDVTGNAYTTSSHDIVRDSSSYITNTYISLEPLDEEEEIIVTLQQNIDGIQKMTISLPCGMRNLSDTITTVNSINTPLKHKSNVVDINIKNLNIQDNNITREIKNNLIANIRTALPKTTTINDINFIDYK